MYSIMSESLNNVSVYEMPDPKDGARDAYARRRGVFQDHGTRGNAYDRGTSQTDAEMPNILKSIQAADLKSELADLHEDVHEVAHGWLEESMLDAYYDSMDSSEPEDFDFSDAYDLWYDRENDYYDYLVMYDRYEPFDLSLDDILYTVDDRDVEADKELYAEFVKRTDIPPEPQPFEGTATDGLHAKASARRTYLRRRKDFRDHGTRDTKRPDYNSQRAAKLDWPNEKPEPTDIEDYLADPTPYDTGEMPGASPDGGQEYTAETTQPSVIAEATQAAVTHTNDVALLLEAKLKAGDVSKQEAYDQLIAGVTDDERPRLREIAQELITDSFLQWGSVIRNRDSHTEENLTSQDLLEHFRDSGRLAVHGTLENAPVKDIDYLDGFSIRSL